MSNTCSPFAQCPWLRSHLEFSNWLDDHGQHALVGVTCNPSCCPLATFLQQRYGFKSVRVTGLVEYQFSLSGMSVVRMMPLWACEFMRRLDRENGGFSPRRSSLVTAGEARRVLREVERDLCLVR